MIKIVFSYGKHSLFLWGSSWSYWLYINKHIKIYLHFLSSLKSGSTPVVEIHLCARQNLVIPPTAMKGRYAGFTLSICPPICLSIHTCPDLHHVVGLFILKDIHLWTQSQLCPLYLPQCLLHPSHIDTFYQITSENVSNVKLVFFLQNSKIWIFGIFLKFVTLILFVLKGIWFELIIWLIMRYSQNTDVLVALLYPVLSIPWLLMPWLHKEPGH